MTRSGAAGEVLRADPARAAEPQAARARPGPADRRSASRPTRKERRVEVRVRLHPGLIAAVLFLVAASDAVAHEGHGDPRWYGSALHYLLEPVHLPVALAASVLLVVASGWATRRLRQRAEREPRR